MPEFKGFIFDIDGTLTSTNALIFATFNHITEKYLNKTQSNEEIISYFGPPEDIIIQEWMGEKYIDARKDYYEFYEKNHENLADIFPGIKEILVFIKSKNLPLSIFTGKGRESTRITLQKLGILDLFDLIVTGDDVANHKPASDGIDLFIEKFKLDPKEVLMIGDAPTDIIAAKQAGVKSASVLWDSYDKARCIELKGDYYFESVDELFKFIHESIK
jgi:HAD superfamily hydrolase (TIGR01549 family)